MSDKIKPWHRRKPRHQDHDNRRKRVVPLRTGGDRRISPLRVDDSRVIPMTVDDYLDDETWENES